MRIELVFSEIIINGFFKHTYILENTTAFGEQVIHRWFCQFIESVTFACFIFALRKKEYQIGRIFRYT